MNVPNTHPGPASHLALIALLFGTASVAAPQGGGEPAGDSVIEEVRVTAKRYVVDETLAATKIATPLVETPVSVSVINRDLLDTWNAGKLTEAMRYVPGIQAEPFGIEPRFTNIRIRGFDAATTGIFRDGLALRNPGFSVSYNLEPWGAERIEIPRGPVSVTYGQGSPGGLVNYISKRPTTESFRELEVEIGNYDRRQAQFDFNGSLIESGDLQARLTGLVRDADTQIDFVEEDRIYIAPSMTWRPSEATRLTILTSYQQDDTKNSQALPGPGTLEPNPNGVVPINRFTGEPDIDEVDRTEYAIGYEFEHTLDSGVTLQQNFRYNYVDLDDTVVFSNGIDPDLRTINRGIFGNFGRLDGFALDNQVRFEVQGGAIHHTLLAGLDYQYTDARSTQSFGAAPSIDIFDPVYGADIPLPAPFKDDDIELEQTGLYLVDQMRLGDAWIVNLSGRFDMTSSETSSRLFDSETVADDDEFTFRAGVGYEFADGLVPYVSYAESFLPVSGTDADGNAFEPETGRQYELGLKYGPARGDLFLAMALFDLERDNVIEFDPATFLPVQIGRARSQGFEAELVANLAAGFDIFANYTYLDTEIEESSNPAIVGNEFTQIPDQIVSLWADYRFEAGIFDGLGVGFGVRHQGENFGDAANTVEVPDFTLVDAAISYDWQNIRFALNMQNLTDDEYAATCFVRSGANFCTFGEARTVRATVNFLW
ncbi:MAG: TonB-dependent siderophore receptor [Xanthomonadales bacterium]|nr:TonB-dependent siderophore receptor [Xanthomonadales bacterium]